ncbi:MAG TPA: class I SAM-dependent methyltransferase [Solirubrobacterales bacterium]|nr:class I SAM-dependent methyltransferase [Solirubrobacterales bacterium]
MPELPEHAARNRAYWNQLAADYEADGHEKWAAEEPTWGIWSVPESQLGVLPADVGGSDSIELGCGTGYVSAWLARRGARPVGIDNSEAQLATAKELQAEHEIDFPLLHGNAEAVPLPDASFDLAISEYGASIWCDPYEWIPEASRLLRPGGQLIFLVNSVFAVLCDPDEGEAAPLGDRLLRPYFGLHRLEWSDGEGSVEFHLPHGELIALLRENGLQVEELIEVRPPDGSTTRYPWARLDWSQRWPSEEVWKARKPR